MSDSTREILLDIYRRLAALDHMEERLGTVELLVGNRNRSYADVLMGAPAIGTASGLDHLQNPRNALFLPTPTQLLSHDTLDDFPQLPIRKTLLPTPGSSVFYQLNTEPQQIPMEPARPTRKTLLRHLDMQL